MEEMTIFADSGLRSGLVWGVGTVLGPVVGGGFQLYTWRWAFYINCKLSSKYAIELC